MRTRSIAGTFTVTQSRAQTVRSDAVRSRTPFQSMAISGRSDAQAWGRTVVEAIRSLNRKVAMLEFDDIQHLLADARPGA